MKDNTMTENTKTQEMSDEIKQLIVKGAKRIEINKIRRKLNAQHIKARIERLDELGITEQDLHESRQAERESMITAIHS